jgi:small subunit ribosomal protein S20
VAHSLSAKKRIRQTAKRRARNRARKETLKDQVKGFLAALTGGNVDAAKEEFRKTTQRLDKVAAKHTIHKNAASRKRSRLAKRLNAMVATGGAPKSQGKGTKAAKASS